MARGSIALDQIQAVNLQGDGNRLATTDGIYTVGNVPVYDATGKLVSSTLPLVIGFAIGDGATGTNIGPELLAPRAGSISTCKLVVKTSDGAVALAFAIKQNGTSVFTSSPTVAAGAAAGSISTFSTFTSSPLPVSAFDIFTIDISSGSASWAFTVQLQS